MKTLKTFTLPAAVLILGLAAMALSQQAIQRDPLTTDDLKKDIADCVIRASADARFAAKVYEAEKSKLVSDIAKLHARIKELETPKAGAVPKLPEGK